MSNLQRTIKNVTRHGAKFPAVITSVDGTETASARLSAQGATLHRLKVVGGPVTVGQPVTIDRTGSEPVIYAYSPAGISEQSILDMILEQIQSTDIPEAFDWQILAFRQGKLKASYGATYGGLAAAIDSVSGGGIVYINDISIETGGAIDCYGVSIVGLSRQKSIINDCLSCFGDCSIENISVNYPGYPCVDDTNDATIVNNSGTIYINNATITAPDLVYPLKVMGGCIATQSTFSGEAAAQIYKASTFYDCQLIANGDFLFEW